MSRPVILSNGRMLVGLNQFGFVHDFYYPYIGLENHATARLPHHKIGVWVDGVFSWIDSYGWQRSIDFSTDALISTVKYTHESLKVEIETHDFIDSEFDIFGRQMTITNHDDHERDIRVFFHQAFQISNSNRGDTAMFVPDGHYIVDYKGRTSLLIYASDGEKNPFDQYSVGLSGIEGREGTYRDAEDGDLSANPVEHGTVDSTLRVAQKIKPNASANIDYWIIAAASHQDARQVHEKILHDGLAARAEKTLASWRKWLDIGSHGLQRIPADTLPMVKKSLLLVKSHMDKRGSVLASADSEMLNYARDNYSYFWPRDGAYAVWPLIKLGYKEEAQAMFEMCRDIMHTNGYLEHKYQPDRAIGSTWHPLVHGMQSELAIQEDETALLLFMLKVYDDETQDHDFTHSLYETLVRPAAGFLERFIDASTKLPHASYDLWEEKFATHTYTTGTVFAGLLAAAELADLFEYPDDAIRWQSVADDIRSASSAFYNDKKQTYYKSLYLKADGGIEYDDTIDISSLYGAITYGLVEPHHENVTTAISAVEKQLLNSAPIGGVPRYEYDRYSQQRPKYKGNPWFITTLWLAQIYILVDRRDDARELVHWCLQYAMPSGVFSEQIDPDTGDPVSVAPLTWSHAELIRTILMLEEKRA